MNQKQLVILGLGAHFWLEKEKGQRQGHCLGPPGARPRPEESALHRHIHGARLSALFTPGLLSMPKRKPVKGLAWFVVNKNTSSGIDLNLPHCSCRFMQLMQGMQYAGVCELGNILMFCSFLSATHGASFIVCRLENQR